MAQETKSGPCVISSTESVSKMPFGVRSSTVSFLRPVRSMKQAAFAAAAAQEPVV
jgi:hypothetical protein